jgi:hypothetical protein
MQDALYWGIYFVVIAKVIIEHIGEQQSVRGGRIGMTVTYSGRVGGTSVKGHLRERGAKAETNGDRR